MADTKTLEGIEELSTDVRNYINERVGRAEAFGDSPVDEESPLIEDVFKDQGVADALRRDGFSIFKDGNGGTRFVAVDADEDGRIVNIAAAVPRNDGRSEEFLKQVADFKDDLLKSSKQRKDRIGLFHRIYRSEGAINNGVNVMASLVATDGEFKIRGVKGKRGKAPGKVAEELGHILKFFKENLNSRALDAVMTGERGVEAWINAGARLALIEGDHIIREVWNDVEVPNMGTYKLPMNLQTFSAQHIEIPEGLEGMTVELLYWVPPQTFIRNLTNPKDENVTEYLEGLMGKEVIEELKKKKKYLLTPELMQHIRHRPTGVDNFGESAIESVMPDIRYKRALDALEIVSIENLINRLVIVKLGSDDKDSVYHKQAVTNSRLGLLQRMFQQVGPSMTILWPGPDIDVLEVSAFDSLMDITDRYTVAEQRIRLALGVPSVLLTGEGKDGKAAGNSATKGLAAKLKELQNQYAQTLRNLAEKIAIENGFEEVDVIWEFNEPLLHDRNEEIERVFKIWQAGAIDTRTLLETLGLDVDVIAARMEQEVMDKWREEVFGPPKGANTTNPAGNGGETGGRPTRDESGNPDPRENKETEDDEANK